MKIKFLISINYLRLIWKQINTNIIPTNKIFTKTLSLICFQINTNIIPTNKIFTKTLSLIGCLFINLWMQL
jgi:hypothetical protein